MSVPATNPLPWGVVIVHFGPPEPTLASVRSVVEAGRGAGSHRIIVVDNSANLDAAALPAGVLHLVRPENPGFGTGANLGVRELARTGYPAAILILNGDIELLPGFFAAAEAALAEGCQACGGPLYLDSANGPLWYAGGTIRTWSGTVSQDRSAAAAVVRREVSFIPGAALAVSGAAWSSIGGFDEAFFLYNEDVDLCLRLRRAGFRLCFVPGMKAIHHLGAATGSRGLSPLYLEHLSRTRLLPYRSRAHRLWLAGLHTGWVACRAAALLLRRPRGTGPAVKALLAGHGAALRSAWSRRLPRARPRGR